jgi:hypothetical protein
VTISSRGSCGGIDPLRLLGKCAVSRTRFGCTRDSGGPPRNAPRSTAPRNSRTRRGDWLSAVLETNRQSQSLTFTFELAELPAP